MTHAWNPTITGHGTRPVAHDLSTPQQRPIPADLIAIARWMHDQARAKDAYYGRPDRCDTRGRFTGSNHRCT